MNCPQCSALVPFDAKEKCPACRAPVVAARAKERGSSAGGARLAAVATFVLLGVASCALGAFLVGTTGPSRGSWLPIWFGIACFGAAAGTRRL